MKKIILSLVILGGITTSCIIVKANDGEDGNRNYSYNDNSIARYSETKTFNVQNFSGVKASQGIRVEIVKSDAEKAIATSNYMEYLRVENKGGVLTIYYETPKGNNNIRNADTKVIVYAKEIRNLRASSAGNIVVKDRFSAAALDVDVSSAGKVQYDARVGKLQLRLSSAATFSGNIDVQSLDADMSSASTVNVQGRAGSVVVETSSAATFNGAGLTSDAVTADASSGSKIKIEVTKELNAGASSGASIRYKAPSGGIKQSVRKSSGGSVATM
ncbi:DUF2807 domain-containing protein [Elizabethkingia meningoseptica]|uniref:head GIN domain-containing protein n=1 Tax=Elizabethkingia meningoseptica TaxID=238 RepID=UPI0023B1E299|nr:head GIN domain-containing protein [Elizabethkingia meningoseptica]MDE5438830.1 DUF2807 domain-containing protein [Elizabethkingia meningoseptica]MDE5507965.1 DUF2807 domain-containing protein [Elizabethkingia meningoseptica]MDE5516167.1 DUF2807 domain-containing protein [Elizabethkingia meningoseptica]MDE5526432.1 DUF2807 domain-containing protein [Elizabethkingia meningoseptica]MDE5530414.1 DUF2807 domain-containing protein [Elizabethkingia meningoseptica]